ncbi:MAG TPA: tetratricopeptide repeat protein [Candidatus Melainabacteria bacterium]|nr:tetratricopeptide repeat protein [Candidatus Melainabacteria bacterium]
MKKGNYSHLISASLLIVLAFASGCSDSTKKDDFSALILDGASARSAGHEDRAANSLKEAFDLLPAKGDPKRSACINQLYPEILALASDLRQSGRFSLSKTMLDKAIEIESECTIPDKKSATVLRSETEKIGEMELSLLRRADKAKELRDELKQLKHTTRDLVKQFDSGDFDRVAKDGRAHLEVLRKTRGAASKAYCEARRLVVESFLHQGNTEGALKLLEDDLPELSKFSDQDLVNADEGAVESAIFLSPLLAQISELQLALGRDAEAEKNARRSMEIARILGGRANPESSSGRLVLAKILKQQGKEKESLDMAKEGLPLLSRFKYQHANWLRCLCMVAQLEDSLGQKKEARRDFNRLVSEAQKQHERGASAECLAIAAAFYRTQDDQKTYTRLKDEAIQISQNESEPPHSVMLVYETLADSSVRFSKFTEALPYYQSALKYSSALEKERLQKKIAACKKNKAVTS